MQGIAALLLAWGTMKPQFIWLLLLFALIYALRERLFPFLAAFAAFLAFFLGLSFWLVPGWLPEWINRVQEYGRYIQGRPTLSDFLGLIMPAQPALVLTGVAFVLCAGVTVFLLAGWWKGKFHWLKIMAWMGMLTYLFHLHGISYEQAVFLLPMILWLGQKGSWRDMEMLGFWLAAILISWLAFAYNPAGIAIDRAPVLFNAVWVARLFSKPGFQV